MFNQPEIVERITTMSYDMPHTLKVAPSPADTSGANTINTGKCAMKYEGPWFLPQLNSQKLRDAEEGSARSTSCSCRRPPASPAGRIAAGAKASRVTKTDLAEAAWAFRRVPGERRRQQAVLRRSPAASRRTSTWRKSWWVPRTKELYQIENGQAFLDAFKEGQIDVVSGNVPRSKMWSEVVKPTAWDTINNGSAKPAEVFPQVDEKLNALLGA